MTRASERTRPVHRPARALPSRPSVSVVIPAKNEAANIEWVLRRLPRTVNEVILVDGCSTDGTVAAARRGSPGVVVVSEKRPGKGVALRTGFQNATGDIVVMIDADGSMDPREIPIYVDHIVGGYDVVKGSRYLTGGGSEDITVLRSMGNRGLNLFVNVLFGSRFSDLCYGYCAFRRACIGAMALDADGFEIETQIVVSALKAGLRIIEVPSVELRRRSGQSNLHAFRDGRRVLTTIVSQRVSSATAVLDGSTPPVVDLRDPAVIDLRERASMASPA